MDVALRNAVHVSQFFKAQRETKGARGAAPPPRL